MRVGGVLNGDDQEFKPSRCSPAVLRYHLYAGTFNPADTVQYFFSFNYFLNHLGLSDHPLSDLQNTVDKVLFGSTLFGTGCTIIANQYAYFLLSEDYFEGKNKERKKLSHWRLWLLGLIVAMSVSNKSIATASSFLAFINDYTQKSGWLWTNCGLALIANILAQASVQGVSGDWHAGLKEIYAKVLAGVFSLYYTFSVLALNWNSIDNACIVFGLFDERPRLDSEKGIIKLLVISPFFLGALLRIPVVYFNRILKLLLPAPSEEKDIKGVESKKFPMTRKQKCCAVYHETTGYLSGIQRTGCMLLAVAATCYDHIGNPLAAALIAIIFTLICLKGTLTCNLAVLFPKETNVISNGVSKTAISLKNTCKYRLTGKKSEPSVNGTGYIILTEYRDESFKTPR